MTRAKVGVIPPATLRMNSVEIESNTAVRINTLLDYLRDPRTCHCLISVVLTSRQPNIMRRIRQPLHLLRPTAFPFLYPLRISIPTPNPIARAMSSAPPTVQKSEDEWRAVLNKEQFRILRQKGTEAAGTGEYEDHKADGACVHLKAAL
jgi:SelR domain